MKNTLKKFINVLHWALIGTLLYLLVSEWKAYCFMRTQLKTASSMASQTIPAFVSENKRLLQRIQVGVEMYPKPISVAMLNRAKWMQNATTTFIQDSIPIIFPSSGAVNYNPALHHFDTCIHSIKSLRYEQESLKPLFDPRNNPRSRWITTKESIRDKLALNALLLQSYAYWDFCGNYDYYRKPFSWRDPYLQTSILNPEAGQAFKAEIFLSSVWRKIPQVFLWVNGISVQLHENNILLTHIFPFRGLNPLDLRIEYKDPKTGALRIVRKTYFVNVK